MPGDIYPSPKHYDETPLDSGNVLEFHKGREDLIPQPTIEAQRHVEQAYQLADSPEAERSMSPVEIAAYQLTEVIEARMGRAA